MSLTTDVRRRYEFTASIELSGQLADTLCKVTKFQACLLLRAFNSNVTLQQAIGLWEAANANKTERPLRTYIAHVQTYHAIAPRGRRAVGMPIHLVVQAFNPETGKTGVETHFKTYGAVDGYDYRVERMQEVDPMTFDADIVSTK